MAARKPLTKLQQDQVREAIKTSQLVNRLQAFALGKLETDVGSGEDKPLELDSLRVKAIEILLRKTLPDLQAIQHTGTGEGGAIIFKSVYE